MKALSIKQPWAWLICAGYKDVENRTWRLWLGDGRHALNLPCRIYVHAGKMIDYAALAELVEQRRMPPFKAYDIQTGAIIGEVTITGCVTESKSPWFTGPYGFTLANPVLYDKPIPYKGQLGFFNVILPSGESR